MRVFVTGDEWYPMPCIEDLEPVPDPKEWRPIVDLPEDLIVRWRAAADACDAIAGEIWAFVKADTPVK